MRFEQHYINEVMSRAEVFEKMLPKIQQECSKFILECQVNNIRHPVWRGSSSKNVKSVKKIKARTNRMPKDTPSEIHDYLDDLFYKYHRKRARSEGIFTIGRQTLASHYGKTYLFIPVSPYKYLWSPRIKDLYSDVVDDYEFQAAFEMFDHFNDYDEWEHEWEHEYGEGNAGHYEYEGNRVSSIDKDDAVNEIVTDKLKEIGVEPDDDDYNDEYDRIWDEVEWGIQWVPAMDYEDYADEKRERVRENMRNEIEDIIKGYKSRNLKEYIKNYNDHELTFICDHYYLVNSSLIGMFRKHILGTTR